jgi:hypothetical protein
MSGENPTLAEDVVRQVVDTCREVDHNARLVSMTKDPGGHLHMRVRAGDVHSVNSLQRALADAMPLSESTVLESWTDGTLEADITVFTRAEEYWVARKLVTRRKVFQYWIALAWIVIFLGTGEWIAAVRMAWAPPELRDEL